MNLETVKLGKKGTLVIPAKVRQNYGFKEGSLISVEEKPEGVLLRPVVAISIEKYTTEQKAKFLLANSVTKEDYAWTVREVRKMGLEPDQLTEETLSKTDEKR
jgi:AbrB family looped-hinge helix DNA binding protein